MSADPGHILVEQKHAQKRHAERQNQTKIEISSGLVGGFAFRTVFGDGSLDPGSTDRDADGKDRENKLIDAKTFCTDPAGEEYSIIKADQFTAKPGDRQDQCAGDQAVFQ